MLSLLWLLFQGSVIDGLLLGQPARRSHRRRDAGRAQPAALRDPQRRRRPHLRRALARDRRGRRALPALVVDRAHRALRGGGRDDADRALSRPRPALRPLPRPQQRRARPVGLHGLLLGRGDPDHARHHRFAALRGLGVLQAGAAGRVLLRTEVGTADRHPRRPDRRRRRLRRGAGLRRHAGDRHHRHADRHAGRALHRDLPGGVRLRPGAQHSSSR